MQTHEVLTTMIGSMQSKEFLWSGLAALILCKQARFDSIWDLTNRICDQYLPQENEH